jgi:signal transduction histidine kinase
VALSAERREVALSVGPLVETSVAGDPFWLHQLFDAVLEAAVASAPRGGDVAVWAEKLEDPATCVVTLRARPAPPESISRGEAEKPEPLGAAVSARLSLAREVARAHGGELRSEPREPGEVEHQLRLPA